MLSLNEFKTKTKNLEIFELHCGEKNEVQIYFEQNQNLLSYYDQSC